MARVLIDASAAGEKWLTEGALPELLSCPRVIFLYSHAEKYSREMMNHPKILQLLKLLKDKGRREDTDVNQCSKHVQNLENNASWKAEDACDDPHIFAIAFQKPGAFVFTKDKRLTKCRSCMKNVLEKRYRSFSTIQSGSNYRANRVKILS